MSEHISCDCQKCIAPCLRVPGWMLPSEARKAINNGFATRLMRDWWEGDDRIYVLAAASLGNEGDDADEMPDDIFSARYWSHGRCTFLTKDNKCELHDTDFKPNECTTAVVCKRQPGTKRDDIAKLWDTDEGREVIALWDMARRVK